MQFTTALLNNAETNGFYDGETRHINNIHLLVNESGCTDQEYVVQVVNQQEAWAQSAGSTLAGIVGDYCSDASLGVATHGNFVVLPQLSYAALTTDLNNKDIYKYFARSSYDNQEQAIALVELLYSLRLETVVGE